MALLTLIEKKTHTQSLIWETNILVLFYTRKAKTLVEVLYPIPTYTQLIEIDQVDSKNNGSAPLVYVTQYVSVFLNRHKWLAVEPLRATKR